jgi:hypothetical protein
MGSVAGPHSSAAVTLEAVCQTKAFVDIGVGDVDADGVHVAEHCMGLSMVGDVGRLLGLFDYRLGRKLVDASKN